MLRGRGRVTENLQLDSLLGETRTPNSDLFYANTFARTRLVVQQWRLTDSRQPRILSIEYYHIGGLSLAMSLSHLGKAALDKENLDEITHRDELNIRQL